MTSSDRFFDVLIRLYPSRVRREHGKEMHDLARRGSRMLVVWDLLRGLPRAHIHEALSSPQPVPLRITVRRHAFVHVFVHALLIVGTTVRMWQTTGYWPNNAFEYPCFPAFLRDIWDAPLRLYIAPVCAFQDSVNLYFSGIGIIVSLSAFVVPWTALNFSLHLLLRRVLRHTA